MSEGKDYDVNYNNSRMNTKVQSISWVADRNNKTLNRLREKLGYQTTVRNIINPAEYSVAERRNLKVK